MDVSGDSESESGTSTTRNNSINLNDPCSPYLLHPSDDRNDIITPVLLIGSDNYDEWCESITTSLRARNKLGFVDGTIPMTPLKPCTVEQENAWKNVTSMVVSWINNTLDEPIKQDCSILKHPRILWNTLKYMYAIKNVPKAYELWSRLASTKQQGMCVKSYYTMLSDMWKDLHDFAPLEACPCPQGAQVGDWLNCVKVCQFLMGLDDAVFGTVRSHILNMKPVPTINLVYDMILKEEEFLVARGAPYSTAQDDTARLRDIEFKSRTKRSPSVLPLPPSKQQALDSSDGSSSLYDLVGQTQNISLMSAGAMDISGGSESVTGTGTTRNDSINFNDPCSPYFLHPSYNRNDKITPVVLVGSDNYDEWCESITTSLKARNKLGFIDGTLCVWPPSSDEHAWACINVNFMVSSWIKNTLDEPIKQSFSDLINCKVVWDRLKNMYGDVKNVPKTYELWSRIGSIKQQGMCVKSYYTMLSGTWKELHNYAPLEACPCGPQGMQVVAWLNCLKICQFLMGLDDAVFGTIRSHILNMKPVPTINHVYDMILKKEHEHLINVTHPGNTNVPQCDTMPG